MVKQKTDVTLINLVLAALLCAIGFVIPMFSPLKINLEPASFTLASHVAIFLAMYISPSTGIFVALGTALGFFFTFPQVVAMRALTHIIFAAIGGFYLKNHKQMLMSIPKSLLFNFIIAVIHAVCEVLIVIPYYFGNTMSSGYYDKGFFISVILLVGVGTIVHSMFDFIIAQIIWKPVSKVYSRISA